MNVKFFSLLQCKKYKDYEMDNYFKKITKNIRLKYTFNPSFYFDEKIKILAFRGISKNDKMTSYVSIERDGKKQLLNLSEQYNKQLGITIIDPKVNKLGDEIYITFHSGYIKNGNDMFIMKVFPKVESPKKLVYENRKKQERNWTFFSEAGEIYCLYWINPLKILKVVKRGAKKWELKDHYISKRVNPSIPKGLTIGTPLNNANGRYYFVCHKKYFIIGKKLYLGKFVVFNLKKKNIVLGRKWLSHSFFSLFGARKKYNTNLFSCTYFSGIQVIKNKILLGYGINDLKAEFSTHSFKELF